MSPVNGSKRSGKSATRRNEHEKQTVHAVFDMQVYGTDVLGMASGAGSVETEEFLIPDFFESEIEWEHVCRLLTHQIIECGCLNPAQVILGGTMQVLEKVKSLWAEQQCLRANITEQKLIRGDSVAWRR